MASATVSSKGWIVIPAEYRRKYRLKPGDKVRIVDYGGVLSIVPAFADPIREAAGILRGKSSLRRALLEERAKDGEYEEART
ncbi:AbrB/MazE/SpoVT family DNA-binding domain-containing protein [Acidobacteria bacterium AH-259-L09]|nr:AbrB/MazE/SpoVT family DNA-binding domain-containing protein [Acidobacteria bacterium AH-259-L09]